MDKVDFSADSTVNPLAFLGAGGQAGTKKAARKKAAEKAGAGKTGFDEILERSFLEPVGDLGPVREVAPSEEAVQELLDQVRGAGDDLKNRPFPEEILRYKQAVRNFVHYVVENGYTVERFQTHRREMKGLKPHVQIQIIDAKLEELAARILTGQAGRLERVSKIDEIAGLLVDITVTGRIRERDE
jgi:uncharacterized protein YaaR (DUF327 family)